MLFSQRKGYTPVLDTIQFESMNDDLRNSLWSLIDIYIWHIDPSPLHAYNTDKINIYFKHLWLNFFKQPTDTIPVFTDETINKIRIYFFDARWHEIYSFMEFTLKHFDLDNLNKEVNTLLKREFSAYRFIGSVFTEITDEQEITLLNETLTDNEFPGASNHLQRSLELLSNRQAPDYPNSIKESISSVESLVQAITNKSSGTLGTLIKSIDPGDKIHPAFKEAISKLYGYTSNKGGIRHANFNESNKDIDFADAKFILILCTSFIYYIKSKLSV